MASILNKKEEFELRSEEVQELLNKKPNWILRNGILLIGLLIVLLLTGSCFIKYPEIISAELILTTTKPSVDILTKKDGKLSALFIEDQESVLADTPLALLENPASLTDILEVERILDTVETAIENDHSFFLSKNRKKLTLGDLQPQFISLLCKLDEYYSYTTENCYQQKKALIQKLLDANRSSFTDASEQKKHLIPQHNTAIKSFEDAKELQKKLQISEKDFVQETYKYLQSEIDVNRIDSTLKNLETQILFLEKSLIDLNQKTREKDVNFKLKLKSLICQMRNEIFVWKTNYVLTSPINGKVIFSNTWSIDQNIRLGEKIFIITPNDGEIIGKIKLPIEKTCKIKIGQAVNIRFNNYPDNQFGIVKGVTSRTSLIPTEKDNYTIEIKFPDGLKTSYDKELQLLPDMTAKADIIIKNSRLINRFLLLIKQIFSKRKSIH